MRSSEIPPSIQHALIKSRRQRLLVWSFLALLAFLVMLWLSLISGSEGVRWGESARILEPWEGTFGMILQEIRLQRALGAFLAGAALGLSGALMQGALRNPLASPFTLGVSQAAAFGASCAIIFQSDGVFSLPPFLSTTVLAFCSSLFCTLAIMWLGRSLGMRPSSMILSGVALGALFGAMTMFVQYFASDDAAAATLFWTFGDIGKGNWQKHQVLFVALLLVLFLFWMRAWRIDALLLGDERAGSLGVGVSSLRLWLMVSASLLSSVAVSYFGIIGFVGLIAPHLVRMVLGDSYRLLLPFSLVCGGVLLMGADLLSRLILLPSVLPVGILTAFLGAPMFLYLLVQRGRKWR